MGSVLAEVSRNHAAKISNEEAVRAYSADLPFAFELADARPTAQVLAITLYRIDAPVLCEVGSFR